MGKFLRFFGLALHSELEKVRQYAKMVTDQSRERGDIVIGGDCAGVVVTSVESEPVSNMANRVSSLLPEGWVLYAAIEAESAWVELLNPNGEYEHLPDAADRSLAEQIDDALFVAREIARPRP